MLNSLPGLASFRAYSAWPNHHRASRGLVVRDARRCRAPHHEGLRLHPEELAKQASRRMDTTQGLAAILRDARKGALLRV
jgi:hypothetical protein